MSTERKTCPDSEPASLRQRAKASRASATRVVRGDAAAPAASPNLLAMVAEWQENMRLQNEVHLSDEEAAPIYQRGVELQRAVLAFPARSVADLKAKVPVLRDELNHTDSAQTPQGIETLDHAAWVGVIRDIEQLAPPVITSVPEECAASQLGEMLEKAWKARDEWDEFVTPETRDALGVLEGYTLQKIDDLQMGISFVRASSPVGMLTQIAVAFSAIDLAVHGSTRTICESASDQAERCLFSVAAALCAMTGIDRNGFAVGRYMAANCDQFAAPSSEVAR